MQLAGKTALITGAGRGIGRAIALRFAEAGCNLTLAARTESELVETAKELRVMGVRALTQRCDVSAPEQVQAAVDQTLTEFGVLDILVNNAGYACFKPFHELTLDEWRQTLDVNLTGTFLCTQAALPHMMERRAGRIINISSVSGLKGLNRQSAYCAAKHGINGLSKTLALELRDYGISVHAICPGGVVTQMTDESMPGRDKTTWMQPGDIAYTALYLAALPERTTVDVIHVRRFGGEPL